MAFIGANVPEIVRKGCTFVHNVCTGLGTREVWVSQERQQTREKDANKTQINCALREGKMDEKYGCDLMPRQRGIIDPKPYTS